MTLKVLEGASGVVGIGSGLGTAMGSFAGWLTTNATLVGLLFAAAGLGAQMYFSDRRDRREEEEHALRMAVLERGEDDGQ